MLDEERNGMKCEVCGFPDGKLLRNDAVICDPCRDVIRQFATHCGEPCRCEEPRHMELGELEAEVTA